MRAVMDEIKDIKLVPVVKLDHVEDAVPLGEALCRGKLPVAEVTFRTEAAEESIRRMIQAFPQMLIGAGTIINVEQAKRARNAGAQFLVSPGFSRSVTEYAQKEGIPILPGACTPTEIMAAMDCGIDIVKFFPAGQYGGLAAIKALSAPFPSVRFMPTGGVNQNNIRDYLGFEKVIACGGSWMVKDSLIAQKQFKEIEQLSLEAVELINR